MKTTLLYSLMLAAMLPAKATEFQIEPDLAGALDGFLAAYRGQPTRIFCTYTAMMALRKLLAARFGLAGFAQEGE